MFSFREYIQHRRDWSVFYNCTSLISISCNPMKLNSISQNKQAERISRIVNLPPTYHAPITAKDRAIHSAPIQALVRDVQQNVTRPLEILRTYGKMAIMTHEKTNCLTEVMIEEAEDWLSRQDNYVKRPLAGIPVSLKDTIIVGGFDTSVGYSCKTGKPYAEDGGMVRLLRDAGRHLRFISGQYKLFA